MNVAKTKNIIFKHLMPFRLSSINERTQIGNINLDINHTLSFRESFLNDRQYVAIICIERENFYVK